MLYCSTCLYPAPCGRCEDQDDSSARVSIDWMCQHQYRWFGQTVVNGRSTSYVYLCQYCGDEQQVPSRQLGNRSNHAVPKKS